MILKNYQIKDEFYKYYKSIREENPINKWGGTYKNLLIFINTIRSFDKSDGNDFYKYFNFILKIK